MFEKLSLTQTAQFLLEHTGSRLGVIANNIANANTPGFKASDLQEFKESYLGINRPAMRHTRSGHITSSSDGLIRKIYTGGPENPNGNDVSLELQMVKAAEVRQFHEMALAIYQNTSSIIRTSLGRSG